MARTFCHTVALKHLRASNFSHTVLHGGADATRALAKDIGLPLEEAERTVLTAVAPLGREYVNNMRAGFAGGWMDVYPTPGKQGGAYMDDAAYGVHPYLLLNYNDDYESMSTLAHEWGHAMHSYSSMKSQPYATSQYATFIAEIASTFNEALLVDMMIAKAKTDDEKDRKSVV